MVEKCYIPSTLEEALQLRNDIKVVPLAGGSDLMVQHKRGLGMSPKFDFPIMIISSLKELKGISVDIDGTVSIKALTTSAEIAESNLVPLHVKKAASLMGAISLRNSATIGGNVGNASPKGDLPQPLILLDASVVLQSVDGIREVLLDDFIKGAKKSDLRDNELIIEIKIPKVDYTYGFYKKIGTRRANAISKLSLSSLLTIEDGIITDFRISSGASGPKVIRSRENEKKLIGKKLSDITDALIDDIVKGHDEAISPRAMASYRRGATARMLSYFLNEVKALPQTGMIE